MTKENTEYDWTSINTFSGNVVRPSGSKTLHIKLIKLTYTDDIKRLFCFNLAQSHWKEGRI